MKTPFGLMDMKAFLTWWKRYKGRIQKSDVPIHRRSPIDTALAAYKAGYKRAPTIQFIWRWTAGNKLQMVWRSDWPSDEQFVLLLEDEFKQLKNLAYKFGFSLSEVEK